MCDKCNDMREKTSISIQYKKGMGAKNGEGLIIELKNSEHKKLEKEEMIYLLSYAVADIFEIGSELIIKLSDNKISKRDAYDIIADFIVKILTERHSTKRGPIPRDEKAEFMRIFAESRNKTQK